MAKPRAQQYIIEVVRKLVLQKNVRDVLVWRQARKVTLYENTDVYFAM